MPTINPKQVVAFRAVMLTGSITRAASMIHLTQPAVSRLIKEFERTVALKLFERTGSGIVPTREANLMFVEVERLFTSLDRILELAIELRQEPSQSIRIAAFPAIGNGFLPRMVSKLRAHAPKFIPTLESMTSGDVIDFTANDGCDLGLAGTIPEHPSITVAAIETIPFVVVLPRNHPLTSKTFLEPKDFSGRDFIPVSQTIMNLRLGTMFSEHGVTPNIVAKTRHSTVGCAMAAAGLGLCIADPFAAEEARLTGAEVRPLIPSIPFEFAYVLPAKSRPFAIVTEMIRILQNEIAHLRERQSI